MLFAIAAAACFRHAIDVKYVLHTSNTTTPPDAAA